MKYASLGTVSHGTLRSADLLNAFSDALEDCIQRNAELWCSDEGRQWRTGYMNMIGEAREVTEEKIDDDPEEVSELLMSLCDALTQFAPPYCAFCQHEGDGSDYGFWPVMENINELPCLTDGEDDPPRAEQAKALGEDCRFVNDHGNVTVYASDGSILLELV